MNEIEQKLDLLAEFHAQKDLLEIDKRRLLDDVKIPAEVEAVVSDGMKRMAAVEAEIRTQTNTVNAEIEAELSAIVIPAEIKEALAEIERRRAEIVVPDEIKTVLADIETKRAEISARKNEKAAQTNAAIVSRKQEVQAEVEAQTKDVYAQVQQRKNEIEAEFSGKANDVDANIKKLEAEIKAEVKAGKKSVKGKFFHAIYVSGRITWNTDKMEAWKVDHPFLLEARKEGEPSITLRRI